jgi:hypothetical protein
VHLTVPYKMCQRTRGSRVMNLRDTYSGVNFVARTVMSVEAAVAAGDLGRVSSRGPVVNNAR